MSMDSFKWDPNKDLMNQAKHGISFAETQYTFADPNRVIADDMTHTQNKQRYYYFGKVGKGIITVRFTYRHGIIRIFGADYWRKRKEIYEQENNIPLRTDRAG